MLLCNRAVNGVKEGGVLGGGRERWAILNRALNDAKITGPKGIVNGEERRVSERTGAAMGTA